MIEVTIGNEPIEVTIGDAINYYNGTKVESVNGKQGVVVLDHTDVGADEAGSASQALQDANLYTDVEVSGLDSQLATVAKTGDYDDLNNKPDLTLKADKTYVDTQDTALQDAINTKQPTGDYATNTALTSGLATKADMSSLAPVATSGDYTDLTNKRTITGTANQITVTNGDGVSGNPTLSLPQDIHTGASPTFAGGTLTGELTVTNLKGVGATGYGAIELSSYNTGSLKVGTSHVAYWDAAAFMAGYNLGQDLGKTTNYWKNLYARRHYLNSTAYLDGSTAGEIKGTGIFTADNIKRGTGFPNGVVSAPVGSKYIDKNATNGAVEWVKTSGTGNTGWVVSVGDTGWRQITTSGLKAGTLRVRRINNSVFYAGGGADFGTVTVAGNSGSPQWTSLWTSQDGFRAAYSGNFGIAAVAARNLIGYFYVGDSADYYTVRINTLSSPFPETSLIRLQIVQVQTNDNWPTTLPETAQ